MNHASWMNLMRNVVYQVKAVNHRAHNILHFGPGTAADNLCARSLWEPWCSDLALKHSSGMEMRQMRQMECKSLMCKLRPMGFWRILSFFALHTGLSNSKGFERLNCDWNMRWNMKRVLHGWRTQDLPPVLQWLWPLCCNASQDIKFAKQRT